MDDAQREQLAARLQAMDLRKAIREIRTLDNDANMKFWRNSIWDEYQTVFELPKLGVKVILVEKGTFEESKREVGGGPTGWKAQKAEYEYVEARVQPFAPVKR
jgi:hypothetical protein